MAQPTSTSLKNKVHEAGSTIGDKAREASSSVADKAREAASSVASTASDVASNIGQRAEDAVSSVGGGMQSLADTIRENTPHSGMLGTASSSLASGLESSGRYLQEQGLSGMGEDLTSLIRRNPLPALLIGIGIGYLLARATRS